MCVYSGDPYVSGESDVAHVAARLRDRGVRILAIMPDILKTEVLEPRHLETYKHLEDGGVFFHATDRVQDSQNHDVDGKASIREWRVLTGGRHPKVTLYGGQRRRRSLGKSSLFRLCSTRNIPALSGTFRQFRKIFSFSRVA